MMGSPIGTILSFAEIGEIFARDRGIVPNTSAGIYGISQTNYKRECRY
ncbi:MAG: hypothetical protein KAT91_03885 [Candidatus Aenigmarchaeota archaeon]|nr:hypothetical protein [Candidatus Aenigmarchaeota archaeon]